MRNSVKKVIATVVMSIVMCSSVLASSNEGITTRDATGTKCSVRLSIDADTAYCRTGIYQDSIVNSLNAYYDEINKEAVKLEELVNEWDEQNR